MPPASFIITLSTSTTQVRFLTLYQRSAAQRLARVDPVLLVVGTVASTVIFVKLRRLIRASEKPVYTRCLIPTLTILRLLAYAFQQLRRLPAVKARIEKELGGAKAEILETIHKDDSDRQFHEGLPVRLCI